MLGHREGRMSHVDTRVISIADLFSDTTQEQEGSRNAARTGPWSDSTSVWFNSILILDLHEPPLHFATYLSRWAC